MPQHWNINDGKLTPEALAGISRLLLDGGLVLLPTDTIYGLHALARDQRAVDRIFTLKERNVDKALPVLFESLEQLRAIGAILTPSLEGILAEIWPAPMTAIVPIERPIPPSAGGRTLATRIPARAWLRQLIEITGPLASTSANRSGETPLYTTDDISETLAHDIAGVVDAGLLRGGASTIVDFTQAEPCVLRQGDFAFTQNLWKTVWKSL